eukprot:188664-Lingulodinium_polyedra.AAC.1
MGLFGSRSLSRMRERDPSRPVVEFLFSLLKPATSRRYHSGLELLLRYTSRLGFAWALLSEEMQDY